MAHPGGRPPIYTDTTEFQDRINEYFAQTGVKFTMSGLAYFLGFESRQSCYAYGEKDQFSYIIKRARLRIEQMYEELVQGTTPTGPIFVLKNMDWKDKTEQDMNLSGALGITWNEEKTYITKDQQPPPSTKVLHTKGGDIPL